MPKLDVPKEIRIRYENDVAKLHPLEKFDKGDWIDLYTAETVEMESGDYKEISLGVAMKLPRGYEAIVAPRSSTFKKWGIVCINSIGVIDNEYCGDNDIWKFPALCLVGHTIIPAGTRIAQFRILRSQNEIEFIEVSHIRAKNRGGIGSTGD